MASIHVFQVEASALQFQISQPDGELRLVLPEAGVDEIDPNPEALVFTMDRAEAIKFYQWLKEQYKRTELLKDADGHTSL